MIVPKIIVCPICGKKTWLRIQDGGYLNEYPIRVNCINCRALLKGVYIMGGDSKSFGLKMYNACIEECETEATGLSGENAYTIKNADYVAEISGELPCKKVSEYKGGLPLPPFMNAIDNLDSVEERIERLTYFKKNMEDWKQTKSTAFQLLDEGSIDYIAKALKNMMGKYSYECDHYLKALHCLQEVVTEETKNLFIEPCQNKCIIQLLESLASIDKEALHDFCESIGGVEELVRSFRKAIEVFSDFMGIYPNILPAETFVRYKNKEDANTCISTCSFSDIKTFYQDGYESLISLLFIPVCLDNYVVRNDFEKFDSVYNDVNYRKGIQNCYQYRKLDNGTRVNKMNDSEPYQKAVNVPANRLLRNGIGHNNIKYDGISQQIIAFDLKKPGKVATQTNLMNMAIDCIGLAKSSVIYSEIILFMLREEFRRQGITTIVHPDYYKGLEPNMKCPCGSNKKYKKWFFTYFCGTSEQKE